MYRGFEEYMMRVNQTAQKPNVEDIRVRATDDYIECMRMVGIAITCPEKYVCLQTNDDGIVALPPDWQKQKECKIDGVATQTPNRFQQRVSNLDRPRISFLKNKLRVDGGGCHKVEFIYYGLPHDPECGEFLIPEDMYEGVILYAESQQLRIRAQMQRQYENTMGAYAMVQREAERKLTIARGRLQKTDNPTLRAIRDATRLHFFDGVNSMATTPSYMYWAGPEPRGKSGYEATPDGYVPNNNNEIIDMSLFQDNEKLKKDMEKLINDMKAMNLSFNQLSIQLGNDIAGKMDFKTANDFVAAEAMCVGVKPFMLLIKDDGTGQPVMAYYNGMSTGTFSELVQIIHDPNEENMGGPVIFVSANNQSEFNAATTGFQPKIIDFRDNGLYRYYIGFDMNPVIEKILTYNPNA